MLKLLLGLIIFTAIAKEDVEAPKTELEKTKIEQEVDELDFDKLNDVLKKDKLESYKKEKIALAKKLSAQRNAMEKQKYFYPVEDKFWTMLSELWCVKNALYLKWDFEKADLGIGLDFKKLLESLSLNGKKIRILILDTMSVAHLALPADRDSYFFLLSLPFMRSMDLTKREISVLLLEDMVRADKGYFKQSLPMQEAVNKFGKMMQKNKPDMKFVQDLLTTYNDVALQRGFTFQQQYETTKFMDKVLKTQNELWQAYLSLTQKRDLLVKTNEGFAWYSRFYPSPEMQLTWLQPVTVKNKFNQSKTP